MEEILLAIPDTPKGRTLAQALQMNGLARIVENICSPQPDSVEERMKNALDMLQQERVLKHKYDLAWVMRYLNEEQLKDTHLFFTSVNSFRVYVDRDLGFHQVACLSTLSQYYSSGSGRFPDWTFSDTKNTTECKRRVAVAERFASAFTKGW